MWMMILGMLGSFMGGFVIFRYLLLMEVRLDAKTSKSLYEAIKQNNKFVVVQELTVNNGYPAVYQAICSIGGCPYFFYSHYERLLTAGTEGKDFVTVIMCFRWDYNKFKEYVEIKLNELELNVGIPVELITPYYTDRIGMLKSSISEPKLKREVWEDIAKEVEEVFSGKRDRTGMILYGSPGGGKTSFVKYLAIKHKVPIKMITFSPNFSNHHLMKIFANIGSNCIVLFEDFDNYFDGRNCIIGAQNASIQFTFDIILNGLDGVYNTYEGVVFIMTANLIDRIDFALKNRPSRFKFVREFNKIDYSLLISSDMIPFVEGLNLDQVMRVQEYLNTGVSIITALNKVKKMDYSDIQKVARFNYLVRCENGVSGNADDDWYKAVNSIN